MIVKLKMKFHILTLLHIFQQKHYKFVLNYILVKLCTLLTTQKISSSYPRNIVVIHVLMILVSRCARKDIGELEIHFKRIEKK